MLARRDMFNIDQPATLPPAPRIVCIGDVHGDIGRLIELLKALLIIDDNTNWIAEPKNTIVVQLGDQLDSASRGTTTDWETMPDIEVVRFMDKLDTLARVKGGRVLSMIGNHELMNVMGDYSYVSAKSMEASGGHVKRSHMFRNGGHIAQLLSKRNVVTKIGNIVFCHGGLLPEHLDIVGNCYSIINTTMRRYLRAQPLSQYENAVFVNLILNENAVLWTRKYFDLLTSENYEQLNTIIKDVCSRLNAKSIIVGHNTVSHITPAADGALWLVDAALSRSYDSSINEVLEILYDDDPNRITAFRVIRMDKTV
ncbi:calcineurin-like phosphoesterase [Dishui Lake large algae virus 1]|nr:calcineurin-like phosphoesterase [Dishui Lake large algae virus 1]